MWISTRLGMFEILALVKSLPFAWRQRERNHYLEINRILAVEQHSWSTCESLGENPLDMTRLWLVVLSLKRPWRWGQLGENTQEVC
jgi:hypothetical protein